MTLKLYNFYSPEKLSVNKHTNTLMANATFYLIFSKDGNFKEVTIQIPKKYHYEPVFFNYVDFSADKVNEYNVLDDFIGINQSSLKEKWSLSEEEYKQLKLGLKMTLIREYSTCSFPRKVILEARVLFDDFVNRILRRIFG